MELYPAGTRARIRGLQVHGSGGDRAHAGERTAVNLAGIDSVEARRGMVLSPPGCSMRRSRSTASSILLPGAHPMKHRAPVHFHAGTAEVEARGASAVIA